MGRVRFNSPILDGRKRSGFGGTALFRRFVLRVGPQNEWENCTVHFVAPKTPKSPDSWPQNESWPVTVHFVALVPTQESLPEADLAGILTK